MHENDPRFWTAVLGAIAVKILMSNSLTKVNLALTIVAGIYSAWAFTDFVLIMVKMEPNTTNIIIVSALLSIGGENVLRQVIKFSNSENILAELWKFWRGGGNK